MRCHHRVSPLVCGPSTTTETQRGPHFPHQREQIPPIRRARGKVSAIWPARIFDQLNTVDRSGSPQTIASVREGPGGDSSHKRGRMPSQTPHGLHSTRLSHLPSKTDAPVFSRRLRPENELATKYERSSLGLPENAGKCIIHPPTGF